MFLNVVTLTGADDDVAPLDLVLLDQRFGFVEFGILFKKGHTGPRYPSAGWVDKLFEVARQQRFSAHLCGQYVADLLGGKPSWFDDYGHVLRWFSRIQINTTYEQYCTLDLNALADTVARAAGDKLIEVVLQSHRGFDRATEIAECNDRGAHYNLLHDASGGRGQHPEQWPQHPAIRHLYCGYAGGITPDNIADTYRAVQQACIGSAATQPVWLDMESGVREDDRFSLEKAESCLSTVRALRWNA